MSLKSVFRLLATTILLSSPVLTAPPSLDVIRNELLGLEHAIVHTALARAELPVCNFRKDDPHVAALFSALPVSTNTIPDASFFSRAPYPPYIFYERGNGTRWGDTSGTCTSGSVVSFLYDSFVLATSDASSLTSSVDAALTGTASLLSLVSARIGTGVDVAAAKLAANTSGFCPSILARNATALRALITDSAQEASVKARVMAEAGAWSTPPVVGGSGTTLQLNDTAGPEFAPSLLEALYENYLIKLTSDVEVASLLGSGAAC